MFFISLRGMSVIHVRLSHQTGSSRLEIVTELQTTINPLLQAALMFDVIYQYQLFFACFATRVRITKIHLTPSLYHQ